MQKAAIILLVFICFSSCKSSKRPKIITKKSEQTQTVIKRKKMSKEAPVANYDKIATIVNYAKEFNGVRYKYGGTTSKGMDCSGLIYTAFKREDITIPRTSLAMSKKGKRIDLSEVQQGDLLFFQTNKNKKVVNHVGLVVETQPGLVEFIHSTSSRGVIISSLNESYWNLSFHEARRIL